MSRLNLNTPDNMVFVFGSNEGGIHGAGAARHAYKSKGARWGFSYGHIGQSFAIPTKAVIKGGGLKPIDMVGDTLDLTIIQQYVQGFLAYAAGHPELSFQVTCIGCGLAGLKHEDIAPMFFGAPSNCYFDEKWKPYFGGTTAYWGEG